MMTALALTLALGIVLGLTSRVPALLLIVLIIALGGGLCTVLLGTPALQTVAALMTVQIGYLGASYLRLRTAPRVAPARPGVGAADTLGAGPPER